jgi:Periplasmic component of the Tol biopolymer transport system
MNHSPRTRRGTSIAFAVLAGATGLLATTAPAHADTTPALAPLAWFVGHWHCDGQFANGKPIHSRETFTAELGGHWLRMQHADDPPNRYLADSWWDYDKTARRFVVTLFDNFDDVRHYTTSGWVGDTLTLDNTATSGYIDRFAFQRRGDAGYRVTYTYRSRSGAWQLGDAVLCTRAATASTASTSTDAPPWGMKGDADPVFTPDRQTVVFARGSESTGRLYVAHRHDDIWSTPERAPFSGAWTDFEPAMAPDGSYLVFISNRPTTPSGKPLDGYWGGKSRPGRGGNLWRVSFKDGVWGTPVRLPDIVNASTATYSPAVAADGSVYFTHPDPQTHHTRLYVSHFVDGRFQPPQPLPFTDGVTSDYDPAVAPDQSFLVFSSNRPPTPPNDSDLFVAFATATGWSTPIPLGPAGTEARLASDLDTLHFSAADDRIHRISIGRWLAQHAVPRP